MQICIICQLEYAELHFRGMKGLKMATFSERLKELRKRKKMTQQELAKVTSANQGTIARWEKGILEPSIEQIILLSDTLDSSIDYLLGTVDYDARNLPSVEEYNSFTEEQKEKYTKDLSRGAKIGNLKLGFKMAQENEEARKIWGVSEEEAQTGLDEALKSYVYEVLEELHQKEQNNKK